MKFPIARFVIIAIALLAIVIPAVADPDGSARPGNDEIWVDGPDPVQPGVGSDRPDAAVDNSGRLIFVWDSFSAAGGDRNDVFVRRFDTDGNALGDPIFVNTLVDDDQSFPRVAVAADGSFLVIWQSDEPDGAVDRKWVRSQAFNANANPVGSEQLLSTLPTSEPTDVNADVAALRGGGYVVVWRSRNSPGPDPNYSIQGRRVGANGTPQGGQFQVNSTIDFTENYPAVTQLADGGFLAVWSGPEVHGRRFNASGNPVGNDFQINTLTAGTEAEVDAAVGWEGDVIVVWKDTEGNGSDREIRGRVYNHNLAPLGPDFRINTVTDGQQENVRAGDNANGGFFIAWDSDVSGGGDAGTDSIQARVVTGSNEFAGPQFQLNVWTSGDQQRPGVAGWYGRVAAAWRSPSNPDTSQAVITGQTSVHCDVFCDDFEWGSLWRWTQTIP